MKKSIVNTFSRGFLPISQQEEYIHDMLVHFMPELFFRMTTEIELFKETFDSYIAEHKNLQNLVALAKVKFDSDDPKYRLIQILELLCGIFPDQLLSTYIRDERARLTEELRDGTLITLAFNPNGLWRKRYQNMLEGISLEEIAEFWKELKMGIYSD